MVSTHYLIVKAGSTYNNSDNGLITNVTIDSVEHINREVTVVSSPDYTKIKEGYRVIIHHNILRESYDNRGVHTYGEYHIEGDLYYVPLTEVLMYKEQGGEWRSLDPYCFLKPVDLVEDSLLVGFKDEHKGREHNIATLYSPNEATKDLGIKVGDRLALKPYCEHEFTVDGVLLYKVNYKDILMKV